RKDFLSNWQEAATKTAFIGSMKLHSRTSESKSPEGGSTVPLRTKQQAADYVQCTPRLLERMVRTGWLRAIKLPAKLVRFRQGDLDKFLESGATIGGDA